LGINAYLRERYAKIFRKIYILFQWIADIREIYIKLFTNFIEIDKLLLCIADIRELYVKLFTNFRKNYKLFLWIVYI